MHRFAMAAILALPLSAQTANLLPMDDFLKDWKISKQFTIAVAEKMPAEFYDFKATPEEMSFGQQMIHIAGSLFSRFHQMSGEKLPYSGPPAKITRDVAIEWLNQSFDYVLKVLPKLTDAQLAKDEFKVDWEGRPVANGRDMIMNMFVHVAHHRAQCEVYLRLKGITPPVYTF
ncbi:MAG: DinB family protein [Acidobacteriia bacterium]|nr:DinB family protein [Terriglobia bacterium]